MDILIVTLAIPLSMLASLGTVVAIPLILAAVIEMMTAGRISFGIGNGRLWRRIRYGRAVTGRN
ncbi:hypothetical protein [Brachybacterium paraconglomeratum]|uniref:hypothetical protein n=1 Tax=Brachybacterium paraconglomeratum TaxID=173362 RepID=UPI0022AF6415|nr:hypothetical protein [Brachybacterium paraconglomeratum]MCZ4328162.1 hypothetical protein [Brachybacterium paraconglomeratum]